MTSQFDGLISPKGTITLTQDQIAEVTGAQTAAALADFLNSVLGLNYKTPGVTSGAHTWPTDTPPAAATLTGYTVTSEFTIAQFSFNGTEWLVAIADCYEPDRCTPISSTFTNTYLLFNSPDPADAERSATDLISTILADLPEAVSDVSDLVAAITSGLNTGKATVVEAMIQSGVVAPMVEVHLDVSSEAHHLSVQSPFVAIEAPFNMGGNDVHNLIDITVTKQADGTYSTVTNVGDAPVPETPAVAM